jgi:DNA repair photolyase
MDQIKGRGAGQNIPNRFEKTQTELEPLEVASGLIDGHDGDFAPLPPSYLGPKTQFFKDKSQSILTENNSPDVGFQFSVNAYRGCEHGCAYCYARPTHEYLGMSAGLDFESKIFVKERAPELLRKKLLSKFWEPETIAMSGVTDCYQPAERHLQLTRQCLEVMAEFRNPVAIITKNSLVTRDIDILKVLASHNAALVFISVTTLSAELCGKLEPRTSRPEARLRAIEELAKAGVPVGVNVAPVIPGLTDHELPGILKAAADAGASQAGFTPLRLPLTVRPLFVNWLETHFPDRKEKVLSHIRDIRGGKLNDSQFGSRMRGQGPMADNIRQMFHVYCNKYGLNKRDFNLSTVAFRRPKNQMEFEF